MSRPVDIQQFFLLIKSETDQPPIIAGPYDLHEVIGEMWSRKVSRPDQTIDLLEIFAPQYVRLSLINFDAVIEGTGFPIVSGDDDGIWKRLSHG